MRTNDDEANIAAIHDLMGRLSPIGRRCLMAELSQLGPDEVANYTILSPRMAGQFLENHAMLIEMLRQMYKLGGELGNKLWKFEKPKVQNGDRDAQILQLHDEEGLKACIISLRLGMSTPAVRQVLSRMRKRSCDNSACHPDGLIRPDQAGQN